MANCDVNGLEDFCENDEQVRTVEAAKNNASAEEAAAALGIKIRAFYVTDF